MKNSLKTKGLIITGFVLIALLYFYGNVNAHCDTMDGPVVKSAQKALETENINHVLIWIQKKDEDEIRKAFEKTLSVRRLSPAARDIADMYFFETVVRIHRMGEGAPYTGLKPAGTNLGPIIPEADLSIETAKSDKLIETVFDAIKKGIEKHFKEVMEKKDFNVNNVSGGRDFVKAYVEFVHYVEGIYNSAEKTEIHNDEMKPKCNHHE